MNYWCQVIQDQKVSFKIEIPDALIELFFQFYHENMKYLNLAQNGKVNMDLNY